MTVRLLAKSIRNTSLERPQYRLMIAAHTSALMGSTLIDEIQSSGSRRCRAKQRRTRFYLSDLNASPKNDDFQPHEEVVSALENYWTSSGCAYSALRTKTVFLSPVCSSSDRAFSEAALLNAGRLIEAKP